MPVSRLDLERRERACLAPHAQLSAETRGRAHAEPPPEWRTQYQRDRDRVIHSRAFRRLEYKTQVFLNGAGDHFRNRLTHTIEVAAITRNIARGLRLNEDLAEAIALAHDLGHSPFGHQGEKALDRLMRGHGGFEHNRQSLRVVDMLEHKYPGFEGLNLTWELREGLDKHHEADEALTRQHPSPSLEAQVANLADEIAYYSHDLDDGLEAGLLQEDALAAEVPIWSMTAAEVRQAHGELPQDPRRQYAIRCLIDGQVRDVLTQTERNLASAGVSSAEEVRRHPKLLVEYSPERAELNRQLRKYLYQNLYFNPSVSGPNLRAVRSLEEVFNELVQSPDKLPEPARARLDDVGLHRAVCDHLAAMTDRSLLEEHARLFSK